MQGVFGTTVNDALGFHTLAATESGVLHQQGGETLAAQARIQPKAGNAAAHDQNISAQCLGHAGVSPGKQARSITRSREPAVRLSRSVADTLREQLNHYHAG